MSERTEEVVRQDAAMWALVAEMKAIEAEIEGMKILNKERESQGYSFAYAEQSFTTAAEELRTIAERLRKEI